MLFQKIIGELRQTMIEMKAGNQVVSLTGDNLKDVATVLIEDTMENAASIEELYASIEEIVSCVNSSLEKMDYINLGGKQQITDHVEECKKRMDYLITVINQTADTNQQLDQYMQNMDELSDQIQLLSLNASIEAAVAKSVGSGFWCNCN